MNSIRLLTGDTNTQTLYSNVMAVQTNTSIGTPLYLTPLEIPVSSSYISPTLSTSSPTSTPLADSTSSPKPNVLELDLHTIIIIHDFTRYYEGSISDFKPTYHALADGSLVASPFIRDIRSANSQLASTSALAAFFCITAWATAQYIRRGKVKRKGLFYALLLSQLLGFGAMVILVLPFFNQFVSCVATETTVVVLAALSYALLMTGILGFKAYKCLDSSKFIPIILGLLRITILGFLIFGLTKPTSTRRLSGGCLPTFSQMPMGIIILLHAAEAAFITSCFLFAVWQSSRSSVVRGRVSISVSVRDPLDMRGIDEYKTSQEDMEQVSRGWWDYIPQATQAEMNTDARSQMTAAGYAGIGQGRRVSVVSSHFAPRSYLGTSGLVLQHPMLSNPIPPNQDPIRPYARAVSPSPGSVRSRLSKYMPRMQVFREVVRNELTYSTLLTMILIVIGLLAQLGSSSKLLMNSSDWVVVPWLLLSIFTLGSFGKVVRRHERDAILQHPAAWDALYRAEHEASRGFATGQIRRPYSPGSVLSRVPPRPPAFTNPFSDAYSVPIGDSASLTSSIHRSGDERGSRLRFSSQEILTPRPIKRSPSKASMNSSISSISHDSLVSSVNTELQSLHRKPGLGYIQLEPPPPIGDYAILGSFSSANYPRRSSRLPASTMPPTMVFPRHFGETSTTSLLPRERSESQDPPDTGMAQPPQ